MSHNTQRRRLVGVVAATAVLTGFGLASPASAADSYSAWEITGTPDDYITGGATYSFAPATSTFSLSGSGTSFDASVTSPDHRFWLHAGMPDGATEVGVHVDATRSGGTEHLDVAGDGNGCNQNIGTYRIHQITVDPGSSEITSLALSWEAHCEFGPPTNQGFLAINATGTEPTATTTTLSAPDVQPVGTDLELSGTVSGVGGAVAGGDVEIRRIDGSGVSNRAVVQTGASGAFSFDDTAATGDATYTAVYLGDADHRISSATKWISADQRASTLTASSPTKAERGASIRVHGKLTDTGGAVADASLTLTRTTLAGAHVTTVRTAADGTWTSKVTLKVGGTTTWKVAFGGDGTRKAVTSKTSTNVSRSATRLTISVNDHHIGYGGRVQATIHLGKTYNSRAVTVMQTKAGGSPTKVATGKVNAKGTLTVKVTMKRTTKLTARFLGDYRHVPASASTKVGVAAKLSLVLGGYTDHRSDGYYVYSSDPVAKAHVLPKRPGICVHAAVQAYANGAWHTTATLRCLTLDGSFTGYLRYVNSARPTGAHFRMRVSVSKKSAFDASASPWRYFTYG